MKNIFRVLVLTLSYVTPLFSQITQSKSVKVIWGDEVKESRKVSLTKVVATDKDFFYGIISKKASLSLKSKEISVQRFTKSMEVVNRVEIDLESDGVEREFCDVLMIDNKLQLFSKFYNKKLDEKVLFVQEIDKKLLTPVGELKVLANVGIKNQFNLFKRKDIGVFNNEFWGYRDKNVLNNTLLNPDQFFGIKLSLDSSKVIAVYKVLNPDDDSEIIGINVFDKKLNTIWSKNISPEYDDKEFVAQNYEVDNKGNAYILGRLYDGKIKEKVKGEVNYKYLLLRYNKEGKLINEYPLEANQKFIVDMKLNIKQEQLIAAGFYSNDNKSGIKGSFFNRINLETGKVESSKLKDFSLEFITKNLRRGEKRVANRRASNGKEVGLESFVLDELVFMPDGSVNLIAEQFFIETVTRPSTNGATSTYYKFNYNDILVVKFDDQTGDVLWSSKIKKLQTTVDYGMYSSYALAIVGNTMFFVFNDNLNNYKPNETDRSYTYNGSKKSVATVATLSSKGECEYDVLFVAKSKDALCKPSASHQVSSNELLIYGSSRKNQRFAKIKFDDNF